MIYILALGYLAEIDLNFGLRKNVGGGGHVNKEIYSWT